MIDQNQNIQFKLNSELIGHVQGLIGIKDDQSIKKLFNDFHYADIAEILNELNFEESIYVIKLLDSTKTSDVLTEIDEDIREKEGRQLEILKMATDKFKNDLYDLHEYQDKELDRPILNSDSVLRDNDA